MKHTKHRIKLIHAVYGSVTCDPQDYYDPNLKLIEVKLGSTIRKELVLRFNLSNDGKNRAITLPAI